MSGLAHAGILMRKETFHTSLHLDGCYVYPHLHMSDITTAPIARCVALLSKRPLAAATLATPVEWCEEAMQHMKEQDNSMALRKVLACRFTRAVPPAPVCSDALA